MTIWVRRTTDAQPDEKWHLMEEMAPRLAGGAAALCGGSLAEYASLQRLGLSNPAEADRCGACHEHYRAELGRV